MVLSSSDKGRLSYDDVTARSTGSLPSPQWKTIIYPFDKYEITVVLTQNDEFIGISEVSLKQEFVSYKQKTTPQGYHDVADFYRE